MHRRRCEWPSLVRDWRPAASRRLATFVQAMRRTRPPKPNMIAVVTKTKPRATNTGCVRVPQVWRSLGGPCWYVDTRLRAKPACHYVHCSNGFFPGDARFEPASQLDPSIAAAFNRIVEVRRDGLAASSPAAKRRG